MKELRVKRKQVGGQGQVTVSKARRLGRNGYGIHTYKQVLERWFSTFLTLRSFNTVPPVVVTPNRKIILVATSQL